METDTRVLDESEVRACARLAQEHMKGTRVGTKTPSWRHAEKVAERLRHHRRLMPTGQMSFWIGVAWLHDLLEDAKELSETRLIKELTEQGVLEERARELAAMVKLLTKAPGEVESYFKRIHDSGIWHLSLVKICDRICNLRDGKATRTPQWFAQYVEETRQHIVPLTNNVPGLMEELQALLEAAMAGENEHPTTPEPRQRV